jgi:hypothetical protein
MAEVSSIQADLFATVPAARPAGAVFARLGQPPLLDGLPSGALLGPHALGVLGVPLPGLVGARERRGRVSPPRPAGDYCRTLRW